MFMAIFLSMSEHLSSYNIEENTFYQLQSPFLIINFINIYFVFAHQVEDRSSMFICLQEWLYINNLPAKHRNSQWHFNNIRELFLFRIAVVIHTVIHLHCLLHPIWLFEID